MKMMNSSMPMSQGAAPKRVKKRLAVIFREPNEVPHRKGKHQFGYKDI